MFIILLYIINYIFIPNKKSLPSLVQRHSPLIIKSRNLLGNLGISFIFLRYAELRTLFNVGIELYTSFCDDPCNPEVITDLLTSLKA